MGEPTPEQLAYVGTRVAQHVLELSAANRQALYQTARDWWPDGYPEGWRRVADQIGRELEFHATIVYRRAQRLLASGSLVLLEGNPRGG